MSNTTTSEVGRMKEYKQIIDGVGFALRSSEIWRLACCDCGLVHDVVLIKRRGSWVGVAMKRNKRATTHRRRWLKKKNGV